MNAGEVIAYLERLFPPSMAESWDNPGIQVGRRQREVHRIVVALDATNQVIEEAAGAGAELLVTHHPLILGGISSVSEEHLRGRKALRLAEEGITHFAMHTNYDVCAMADLAAQRLGLTEPEVLEVTGALADGSPAGIGKVGLLPAAMTVEECCARVKERFTIPYVKVFGDMERKIRRVAISPGSGKSMIGAALAKGAEALITGDIGHHEGIDSVDEGMVILDAGHYGTEHLFVGHVAGLLRTAFLQAEVIEAGEAYPFQIG